VTYLENERLERRICQIAPDPQPSARPGQGGLDGDSIRAEASGAAGWVQRTPEQGGATGARSHDSGPRSTPAGTRSGGFTASPVGDRLERARGALAGLSQVGRSPRFAQAPDLGIARGRNSWERGGGGNAFSGGRPASRADAGDGGRRTKSRNFAPEADHVGVGSTGASPEEDGRRSRSCKEVAAGSGVLFRSI